jgi:hypothetical protein
MPEEKTVKIMIQQAPVTKHDDRGLFIGIRPEI